MIGSKTGPATLEHERRFANLWDIGCIACKKRLGKWVPPEQDHRNRGDLAGMPRTKGGHNDTLALCCWHHRGIPHSGWTQKNSLPAFGPSKQLHKKQFLAEFGSIQELHDYQNQLLEEHRARTEIRCQG